MTIYSKRYQIPTMPPDREETNPSPEEAREVIRKLYEKLNYRYLPEREEMIKKRLKEIQTFAERFRIDVDICQTDFDIQARLYYYFLFDWCTSMKDGLVGLIQSCDEMIVEEAKNEKHDYMIALKFSTHAMYKGDKRIFPPE